MDEYSRYIVHHELLWGMDGKTVSVEAQAALETLPKDGTRAVQEKPKIRPDNGSCYISREFGAVLDEHELNHKRIKPHCPEENPKTPRCHASLSAHL